MDTWTIEETDLTGSGMFVLGFWEWTFEENELRKFRNDFIEEEVHRKGPVVEFLTGDGDTLG